MIHLGRTAQSTLRPWRLSRTWRMGFNGDQRYVLIQSGQHRGQDYRSDYQWNCAQKCRKLSKGCIHKDSWSIIFLYLRHLPAKRRPVSMVSSWRSLSCSITSRSATTYSTCTRQSIGHSREKSCRSARTIAVPAFAKSWRAARWSICKQTTCICITSCAPVISRRSCASVWVSGRRIRSSTRTMWLMAYIRWCPRHRTMRTARLQRLYDNTRW